MTVDLSLVEHHPAVVELTDVLCSRTQNTDRGFFQTVLVYFFSKMAACQRASVITRDLGEIPLNVYAIGLATSGYGKGHSVGVIETEFMAGFQKRFMEETMPVIADQNHWKIANERALRNGTDPAEEHSKIVTQSDGCGAYVFTFDSGTGPAMKQLRTKLILGNCGSLNMQVDEIGLNLEGQEETLAVGLELYDQGRVKSKLTKNTAENQRAVEVEGKTPTNMLLFGTPSKLLNGGAVEDKFYSWLDTGYARRSIFGNGVAAAKAYHTMTAEEIFNNRTKPQNTASIDHWAAHFHKLADATRHGWRMEVEAEVSIALTQYRMDCEALADQMPDHDEIRKAEMSHRYFKVLKIAGIYAFIDESLEVEMEHLHMAMKLVEESGEAFQMILNREKTYVKLARYIAQEKKDLTHADLHEALPFYKSGNAARKELMDMARSWGYKNHVIIKNLYADGIEFFRGESLEKTNLEELRLSYSTGVAYNYANSLAPFERLGELFTMQQADGSPMHWINHAVAKGHRADENVIPGFNMIVLDVDGGTDVNVAMELMKDYKFFVYTTKRHRAEGCGDRFRMVIPTNYVLQLDTDDYREFMNAVVAWVPFTGIDESVNQRAKKWETFGAAQTFINTEGVCLDVLPFIPKTSRNADHQSAMAKVQNMDNLERWFAGRMGPGGRNNQMLKFAMALKDGGMSFQDISNAVIAFNKKLTQPLPDGELESTVLRSVAKKMSGN